MINFHDIHYASNYSREWSLDSLAICFGVTCVATSFFEIQGFRLDLELDFDIGSCDWPSLGGVSWCSLDGTNDQSELHTVWTIHGSMWNPGWEWNNACDWVWSMFDKCCELLPWCKCDWDKGSESRRVPYCESAFRACDCEKTLAEGPRDGTRRSEIDWESLDWCSRPLYLGLSLGCL